MLLGFLKLLAVVGVGAFFAFRSIKTRKDNGYTERFFHVPTAAMGLTLMIVTGILGTSFGTIGAGERGVVLRWGATTGRIVQPGFYTVMPLIEGVHPMNVQVQKEAVKDAAAVSHDLQQVSTSIALNYMVTPEATALLYRTVGDDYKSRIVDPAIQEAVKAVTARFTAEELIARRNEVKDMLATELQTRLAKHSITVDAINLTDFQFTEEFTNAVEAKVTAQQNALTAKNNLDKVKYENEQRLNTAQTDAEAIRIQAQAIQASGGREYVQLQAIKTWDGKLPVNMYGSAPVPFLDVTPR